MDYYIFWTIFYLINSIYCVETPEEILGGLFESQINQLHGCVCFSWPICLPSCNKDIVLSHALISVPTNQIMMSSLSNHQQVPFLLVYPFQSRQNKKFRNASIFQSTSTLNKHGEHYQNTKFWLSVLDKKILMMKLEREKFLSTNENKFTAHYYRGTNHIVETNTIARCFYMGKLWSKGNIEEDSYVAVDTCSGLRGVIRYRSRLIAIQPLICPKCRSNDTKPHVVYPVRDVLITRDPNLKMFMEPFLSFVPTLMKEELLQNAQTKLIADDRLRIERGHGALPTLDKEYTLRLGVFIDQSLFHDLDLNHDTAIQYAARIVNIATMLLLPTPLEVNLVAVEVWNLGNQIAVTSDLRRTLLAFLRHTTRNMTRREQSKSSATVLLSRVNFLSNTEHLSLHDSVCTGRMVGVLQVLRLDDYWHVAKLLIVALAEQLGVTAFNCPPHLPCGLHLPLSLGDHVRLHAALATGISNCLKKSGASEKTTSNCGNGIVERGEECDDQSACCDQTICMARPQVTCLRGACCVNCRVLPAGHTCRAAKSICDIPEACDGHQGSCPQDLRLEDGQMCPGGVCVNGSCPSRLEHCRSLWGPSSRPALPQCYNTHDDSHAQCKLLQCQGGVNKPSEFYDKNLLRISKAQVESNGTVAQCNVVIPKGPLSAVQEGAFCNAPGHFCREGRCIQWNVHTAVNGRASACPSAVGKLPENATSCSGHGVCLVPLNACLCMPHFRGRACNEPNHNRSILLDRSTLQYIYWSQYGERALKPNASNISDADKSALTTVFLVTIVGSVAGGIFLCLFLFVACYRRRTYSQRSSATADRRRRNSKNLRVFHDSEYEGAFAEDTMERMIKFGSTPSYKENKLNQILNSSVSNIVKPGSDGGGSCNSFIPPAYTHMEKCPPERGILKNRNIGELQELANLLSEKLGSGDSQRGNDSVYKDNLDYLGQDSAGTTTEGDSEIDESCIESCEDGFPKSSKKLEHAPVIVCNASNQTELAASSQSLQISTRDSPHSQRLDQQCGSESLSAAASDEQVACSETEVDGALLMYQLDRFDLRSNAGTCDSDASSLPDGDLLQLASRLPGGLPSRMPLYSLAAKSLISPTNPNLAANTGATKPDLIGFKMAPPASTVQLPHPPPPPPPPAHSASTYLDEAPFRRRSYARATDSNDSIDTAIEERSNGTPPPAYQLHNYSGTYPAATASFDSHGSHLQTASTHPQPYMRFNGSHQAPLPVKTPKAPSRSLTIASSRPFQNDC